MNNSDQKNYEMERLYFMCTILVCLYPALNIIYLMINIILSTNNVSIFASSIIFVICIGCGIFHSIYLFHKRYKIVKNYENDKESYGEFLEWKYDNICVFSKILMQIVLGINLFTLPWFIIMINENWMDIVGLVSISSVNLIALLIQLCLYLPRSSDKFYEYDGKWYRRDDNGITAVDNGTFEI